MHANTVSARMRVCMFLGDPLKERAVRAIMRDRFRMYSPFSYCYDELCPIALLWEICTKTHVCVP